MLNFDTAERNRLLLEQLPQVHYIARTTHDRLPRHVAMEDLVHAGVLGLIDALSKYDPGKNVQLKSYAKFRIRGAILDSLREMDWSPRDLRRKARCLEETSSRLTARFGRKASQGELAAEMGMELGKFQRLLADLRRLESSNIPLRDAEDGQEEDAYDHAPREEEDPFRLCLRAETKELLDRAIGELPLNERRVIRLYYFEDRTMKKVGAALGVGESRVSQIHAAAISRLRTRMNRFLRRCSEPTPHPRPACRGSLRVKQVED